METLLIKKNDGSSSRWLAKEDGKGNIQWNVLRYDRDGYYLAQNSFGGICVREDYLKNVEMLKDLGKETDFTVTEF